MYNNVDDLNEIIRNLGKSAISETFRESLTSNLTPRISHRVISSQELLIKDPSELTPSSRYLLDSPTKPSNFSKSKGFLPLEPKQNNIKRGNSACEINISQENPMHFMEGNDSEKVVRIIVNRPNVGNLLIMEKSNKILDFQKKNQSNNENNDLYNEKNENYGNIQNIYKNDENVENVKNSQNEDFFKKPNEKPQILQYNENYRLYLENPIEFSKNYLLLIIELTRLEEETNRWKMLFFDLEKRFFEISKAFSKEIYALQNENESIKKQIIESERSKIAEIEQIRLAYDARKKTQIVKIQLFKQNSNYQYNSKFLS